MSDGNVKLKCFLSSWYRVCVSMSKRKFGFATRQIHGGRKIEDTHGSHVMPIYRTSSFDFPSAKVGAERFTGKDEGYIYTRLGNPNFDLLASRIADLEGGCAGRVFSSGMAAISSVVFGLADSGCHIVTSDTLYGCTDSLFRNHLKRFGVDADFIDTRKSENMASAVRDETRLIFIETPTNPTLGITDLAEAARLAKDNELYLVVDNTFATPYLQTPIEFGADVVVHSLTKYIGGHSDLVGGAAAFSRGFAEDKESMRRVKRAVDDFGTNFNPEDAFLALRGLETLDIRMIRHCENAQYVAEYLESHEKIERVYYPGLKSFPQYDLAKRQMKMSGAMVWFIMKDGYDAGERLMNNVKLCSLAVSLGSTATLIQHPASMTHKIIPREEREKIGIVDGGVRLSVGLEDKEDIVWDLDQALNKV